MTIMMTRGARVMSEFVPPAGVPPCTSARISPEMRKLIINLYRTARLEERKGPPLRKEPFANVSLTESRLRSAPAFPAPGVHVLEPHSKRSRPARNRDYRRNK